MLQQVQTAALPVATPRRQRGPIRTLPHRFGRYALFDHIGRGGMADIYLASARTGLGGSRRVVIKEVLPELAGDRRFCEMLVAEAKLAARLSHANVVKVEDLGRDGGVLFIAMEYVEGFDLRELLRRCARDRVALPIEFSLLVVREALRALDYAHRFRTDPRGKDEGDGERVLGIVHRDVSPSNVLISFEGEIKLCDFGIARANDVAELLPEATIQGKAGYMSPEHAHGDPVDARADVFAAGIVLWELLAGRRLYRAAAGETLLDVARRSEVPDLPFRELPHEADLHAIVGRALEPNRNDRYQSAAAFLRDLEEYAVQAHMMASPLVFGDWLMRHFGGEIVENRRSRELALRAIERGPLVQLAPVGPLGTPMVDAIALDVPPPRGVVPPGPIAVTTKSAPPPPAPREPRPFQDRARLEDVAEAPVSAGTSPNLGAVEPSPDVEPAAHAEDADLADLDDLDDGAPLAAGPVRPPIGEARWAWVGAAAAVVAAAGWLLAHLVVG